MYVVIFRASLRPLTDETDYNTTATELRDLALNHYGCLEFEALNETNREVALSYWPDLESIKRWRDDARHREAQTRGREQW